MMWTDVIAELSRLMAKKRIDCMHANQLANTHPRYAAQLGSLF
jgi:UDP-N-acetyl-D-mannosaminuronate dehydrogenase